MIPQYTPGYPPDGTSLGDTKAVIRSNLDGTFLTLGVDHVNNNGQPGANSAGYHTDIHMVTQASAPANITGVLQLFTLVPPTGIPDAINPQLFALSNSILYQLSGNLKAVNGYAWMGGMLIQWGQYIGSLIVSPSPTIFFPKRFPNQCFNVQATLTGTSGSSNTLQITTVDNPSFNWTFTGSSNNSYTGFYWMAIGW